MYMQSLPKKKEGIKNEKKKNRQPKNLGLCVEQLIQQRFNEEEAELATLCLDFTAEMEQRGDLSPRVKKPLSIN